MPISEQVSPQDFTYIFCIIDTSHQDYSFEYKREKQFAYLEVSFRIFYLGLLNASHENWSSGFANNKSTD